MSDTVIKVENLSKKYIIGHQKQGKYTTLRDSIANGAKGLLTPFKRGKSQGSDPISEEFWALKDVSFEIKQGDRIGFIGRNGAGKSTLLKILSRIVEPTSGRIGIKGRVASLLEVGTGFHPELTGRENISLNGAILGMSKAEITQKFDEIVAFAEVEKFLDTPVKWYSSGMYVRLAFSVAAHLEPEILIVDEVLAVGDAQFQKKCLGKMGEVAGEGRTILFVSHNTSALNTLCSQAVYLEQGRVKAVGKAADVIMSYTSDLFSNQMSDLSSLRVSGHGDKIRFTNLNLVSEIDRTVAFGEPISYALTIHSDIDLDGLSIGSSIFNNEGYCIGSLITKENFFVGANQSIDLELKLPNFNLAPGSYYAGLSIGQGGFQDTNRFDLDAVIGRPSFQVVSLAKGTNIISNWHSRWGNIAITESSLVVLAKTS
jgi:lipopolysaccharide transport system ATP-binding protein